MESDALFNQAVLLIWAAEKAIGERRRLETGCGYPEEYGNDKLIHQRLGEFLAEPLVDTRVKKLLSSIKIGDTS